MDADGQVVERFTSKIRPPYLRRTRCIEGRIPWLYRKGVSTGDFGEALLATLTMVSAWCSAPRTTGGH